MRWYDQKPHKRSGAPWRGLTFLLLLVVSLYVVGDFVKELSLTFPNAWDETGAVSERLYRVRGLPTTVFVSAEGETAYVQIGPLSDTQIEMFVEKLMAGEELGR